MRKQFFTKAKLAIVVAAAAVFAPVAQAAGSGSTAPDLSSLTNAVDFSTTITAILAIAGLLAGVYISIKGIKFVLGLLKGH
ncbi:hypothetical protein PQU95_08825 [Vogesella sp. DC21W]|uniref:Phage-related membrane protein n=1 Tax=Vogesella aquatica TaxID=2984206 RepID=A0ABT5IXM7_9NEIS|nr:hypothetical protein [Vogesella aquatica]MDC7717311.1 hypothetical protein [Vogesella aquatica]